MTDDGDGNVIDFSSIKPAAGYDKLAADTTEIERLAALPDMEYERERKEAAEKLGCRVTTLDTHVKRARPKDADDGKAGRKVVLPQIEPWPDPVDGTELLAALLAQLQRFVVAAKPALVAVVLWVLHTHAFEAWWISPKLLVRSATKRCGKTRLFEALERLVARRLLVSLATCSAVFRVIEAQGDTPPTLLMDEADQLTQYDDTMRKLIDAGQTKSTARVMLSVPTGDGWESRYFSTWAPIALAGIGEQAGTIADRAVTVVMRRKPSAQVVEKLRGNRDLGFQELVRKCARWAQDHVEALKDAEPAMPPLLHDRAQDNWEPLLAIADAVGGDWPKVARDAALRLQQEAAEIDEDEVAVQLLHDIDTVFEQEGVDRITTGVLLIRLHDMEERLWKTYGRTETPLKDQQLAAMLRQFNVHSRQMKIEVDGETVNRNGYDRRQIIPILAQYPKKLSTCLPAAETLASYRSDGGERVDSAITAKSTVSAEGRQVDRQNGVYGREEYMRPKNVTA